MSRKILVTNALPYANGDIHLGHLVGYIQGDIWVRYQRMRGNRVHYVCADDTHGTPVMLRAEKEGVTPEALIQRVHGEHLRDFADVAALRKRVADRIKKREIVERVDLGVDAVVTFSSRLKIRDQSRVAVEKLA